MTESKASQCCLTLWEQGYKYGHQGRGGRKKPPPGISQNEATEACEGSK